MARAQLAFGASPETVWQVLADPQAYGHWVVGSSEIRGWDPAWPAVGTRFHHRVGVRPLTIADHTEVVEAEAPRLLVLRAKARPLGVARVEMRIEPHPAGSLVTMIEAPDVPFGGRLLLMLPWMVVLLRLRNGESLRRLRKLAEERVRSGQEPGVELEEPALRSVGAA
jgi:uncharacterized protein YndB with AHSA1/START domain